MGGRASRNKGSAAEREFIKLLEEGLNIKFKRNLEQTRSGGYDVIGIDELAIEVKRCEQLNINGWWEQAVEQADKGQYPVLAYRQSRRPWSVVVPLSLIAPRKRWTKEKATIDIDTFIKLVKKQILKSTK